MNPATTPHYRASKGRPFDGVLVPATVRHTWFDEQGRRCHTFIVECHGDRADENAAFIAEALAKRDGIAVIVPEPNASAPMHFSYERFKQLWDELVTKRLQRNDSP